MQKKNTELPELKIVIGKKTSFKFLHLSFNSDTIYNTGIYVFLEVWGEDGSVYACHRVHEF